MTNTTRPRPLHRWSEEHFDSVCGTGTCRSLVDGNDRMKIGLVAPSWLPVPAPAYGGTEAVVDRLARGFVNAGHEVVLAAAGDSTCPVPRVVTVPRAVGVGSAESEELPIAHAYAALRDCDVIHDHTLLGPRLAALAGDTRVVTTNHGEFRGRMLELYAHIADRIPIIAISHAQAGTAPDLPIAGVIHHGLDPNRYPRGRGNGGYYLFLGRMAPEKGAHRAARIARAAGVRLLIAAKLSEPHEYQYFHEHVEPLLGGDIEYLGEVAARQKLELLAGARALVNPIRWAEPFGLVMIEALACGTPVLAFAEGAAPEIVDHGVTGFLGVDEADLTARLDQVDSIDRDACRSAVRTRFSTQRMVREHLDLFAQVRKAHRAPTQPRALMLEPPTGPRARECPSGQRGVGADSSRARTDRKGDRDAFSKPSRAQVSAATWPR
jgi:glycosyltransferase involved in cell wall biosynthesis